MLFVIADHDLVELFAACWKPPAGGGRKERVNRDPAAGRELEAELLWSVAQVLAPSIYSETKSVDPYSYTRPDASTRGLVFRALLNNDGTREVRFERVAVG